MGWWAAIAGIFLAIHAAQVHIGDVTVHSLLDLQAATAYLSDVTTIEGSVTVSTSQVNCTMLVELLASVQRVTGDVTISSNANLRHVVCGVTEIGGTLFVFDNVAAQAVAFAKLSSVNGSVYLNNSPQLVNCSFPVLTRIGGYLDVGYNAALAVLELSQLNTIGGTLELHNNAAMMAALQDMVNLMRVGGALRVYGNTGLTSVAWPPRLASVAGDVAIYYNPAVVSVMYSAASFVSLKNVGGGLDLHNNAVLDNLAAFAALETVGGGVTIVSNPKLLNLSQLGNLLSIGAFLSVQNNDRLVNISLPRLKALYGASLLDDQTLVLISTCSDLKVGLPFRSLQCVGGGGVVCEAGSAPVCTAAVVPVSGVVSPCPAAFCDIDASCQHGGTCVGGFCICLPGFSGGACADINECASLPKSLTCPSVATNCTNTIGSFVCNCALGFADGSNASCADVDECTYFGAHACVAVAASCVNTRGSFLCVCNASFTGPLCTIDVDECSKKAHNCVVNSEECVNFIGSFACACSAGYSRDNISGCVDLDACQGDPCNDINAHCVDMKPPSTGALCLCNPGFQPGTGSLCLRVFKDAVVIASPTDAQRFVDLLKGVGIVNNSVSIEGTSAFTEEQLEIVFCHVEIITGGLSLFNVSTLTSLEGFRNLRRLDGSLRVQYCSGLRSIEGLRGLQAIGGFLDIAYESFNLTTIYGLRNVQRVQEQVSLVSNPALLDLKGLCNLTFVGTNFFLYNNTLLTSLRPLRNVVHVGGNLTLQYLPGLLNFSGFEGLQKIGGLLTIRNNNGLKSLTGLHNMRVVNGAVEIIFNFKLQSLDGLHDLQVIMDYITVVGNNDLSSLELPSLKAMYGNTLYLTKYVAYIAANAKAMTGLPFAAVQCVATTTALCLGDTPVCTAAAVLPYSSLEIPCSPFCASSADCEHGGECIDALFCDCRAGYFGRACASDINECADASHNCAATIATCVNSPGSFECSCSAGFSGSGVECADPINACLSFPCAGNHVVCSDLPPPAPNSSVGRACLCHAGFAAKSLADSVCVDIDECVGGGNGGHNCAANGGVCTNLVGSFTCACGAAYQGNGFLCENVDACLLYPCMVDSSRCSDLPPPAINSALGRSCVPCDAGYVSNGTQCFKVFQGDVDFAKLQNVAPMVGGFQVIEGGVLIKDSNVTFKDIEVIFGSVVWIKGFLIFDSNPSLQRIGLSNLRRVDGFVHITTNINLFRIDLPRLTRIHGSLTISYNPILASLEGSFNSLVYIDDSLVVMCNPMLAKITGFGALTVVNGFFQVRNNTQVTALTLPKLMALRGANLFQDLKTNLSCVLGLTDVPHLQLNVSALLPALQCVGAGSFCADQASVPLAALKQPCTVCPLSTSFCMNGAACVDNVGPSPVCVCPPGYGGARCSVGTCDSFGCANEGTCRVVLVGLRPEPQCQCTAGFQGPRCETPAKLSSSSFVGAAVGAAAAVMLLLTLTGLAVHLARRRGHCSRVSGSEIITLREVERLLTVKCEETFKLSFAGRFSAEDLDRAKLEFAQLQVPRHLLKVTRVIGQGQSGEVHLGKLRTPNNGSIVPVAVKMAQRYNAVSTATMICAHSDTTLQLEARMLHQLQHVHIVRLEAVVLQPPIWICLEYMRNGDLKSYLRACRPVLKVQKQVVTHADFVGVLTQVCDAMAFLELRHVVHRDIAARNVLVGTNLQHVKLGDLGATRVLAEDEYYQMQSNAQVPLKWMAPECIREAKYTSKSDVWAFGVLAYEVTSFAMTPYGALGGQELLQELETGYRLPQPAECSSELYAVMQRCWKWTPADRPNFGTLLEQLGVLEQSPSFVDENMTLDTDLGMPDNARVPLTTPASDDGVDALLSNVRGFGFSAVHDLQRKIVEKRLKKSATGNLESSHV